jgi:hypothetical protein
MKCKSTRRSPQTTNIKIVSILLFAASIASSQAATSIQYSFTGRFAGSLNGVAFSAPVKISMLSNTASNTSASNTSGLTTTTFYTLFGETSIDIGDDGLDVLRMTGLTPIWTTPAITASRSVTLGIYSETVALAYFNPATPSVLGRTTLGTKSNGTYDCSGPQSFTFSNNPSNFQTIETTGGTLLFSSGGPVTLTATVVPEPSAAALLGLGAFGLIARRRGPWRDGGPFRSQR